MTEIFLMDGKTWDITVKSIEEQGVITDTDKSGRSLSGKMSRDIIGTFYNYTMVVKPKNNNFAEFDAFYSAITTPVESHVVSFPHNQSLLTFEAYITSANRPVKKISENSIKWGDLSINFISTEPQIPYGGAG